MESTEEAFAPGQGLLGLLRVAEVVRGASAHSLHCPVHRGITMLQQKKEVGFGCGQEGNVMDDVWEWEPPAGLAQQLMVL